MGPPPWTKTQLSAPHPAQAYMRLPDTCSALCSLSSSLAWMPDRPRAARSGAFLERQARLVVTLHLQPLLCLQRFCAPLLGHILGHGPVPTMPPYRNVAVSVMRQVKDSTTFSATSGCWLGGRSGRPRKSTLCSLAKVLVMLKAAWDPCGSRTWSAAARLLQGSCCIAPLTRARGSLPG